MKKILSLLFCISFINAIAQTYDLAPKYILNYETFESKGAYTNGNKNGRWVDSTKAGTIYKESFYNNGKPTGIWKIYYPDGNLRKEIGYDSKSHINLWRRYFDVVKRIEIIPDSIIDIPTIMKISTFEDDIFELESLVYVPVDKRTNRTYRTNYASIVATNNNRSKIDFSNILQVLNLTSFSGNCYVYNIDRTLRNEVNYKNGKQGIAKENFYRNKKLNYTYFFNETIMQNITKYDSKGNIKSVKIMKK
jgi:antitoxin component YwqK of YwqJK toxin-antitoxin module